MQVKFEIDKASRKKFEDTLKKFADVTGKSVEDGINEIALSSAKRLAFTMQPYGLNKSIGKVFQANIGRQVDTAWFGTNLGAYPQTSEMRQAHNNARVNGRVPPRLFRKEKGKPWLDLISAEERNTYKEKQMAKAGRAKAAWIKCGNELGKTNISGVAVWIGRHVANGYGSVTRSGNGLKYKITMANNTPYLTDRMQSNKSVAEAMVYGMKNGFKRLQTIIDKEIQKLNA